METTPLKKVGQEGKTRVREGKEGGHGLIKGSEVVWVLWGRVGSLPADENTHCGVDGRGGSRAS